MKTSPAEAAPLADAALAAASASAHAASCSGSADSGAGAPAAGIATSGSRVDALAVLDDNGAGLLFTSGAKVLHQPLVLGTARNYAR